MQRRRFIIAAAGARKFPGLKFSPLQFMRVDTINLAPHVARILHFSWSLPLICYAKTHIKS